MEMLELLVKLASFGTSGVCVLAVFYIGVTMQKLPNNSPAWKPQLMKRYMNMCVIIAVICALSGGVNAYFNQNKIKAANNRFVELGNRYQLEREQWLNYRKGIENDVRAIQNTLSSSSTITPQLKESVKRLEPKITAFQLKSKDDLVMGLEYNKTPSP